MCGLGVCMYVYTYLHVEYEGLGFMSYLKLYSCVYLGPRADMYLLSLST